MIFVVLVYSCKSQNIVKNQEYTDLFIEKLDMEDFYIAIKITHWHDLSIRSSEFDVFYMANGNFKFHSMVHSLFPGKDKDIDTCFILTGMQISVVNHFFSQVEKQENMNDSIMIAGNITKFAFTIGDKTYTHTGKSYYSLYEKLIAIKD